MIDGGSGGSSGSGGLNPSELAGYATQSWVNGNFVTKPFWNQVFEIHGTQTVTVTDENDDPVGDPVVTDITFLPNEVPTTTETIDEETGYKTTTVRAITSIEAKVGLWTNSYLSALGQNSSGGGGGGSLNEPLLSINTSGLSAPGASQDGMTIVWDNATQKWKYGSAGGGGSVSWSNITNKPTTINGFGITDAKIVNGTITLGNQSITPLTSSDISDMATKTWVGNQNYLTQNDADSRYISISFFARLFQAKNGSANVNPNDTTSTIDSIKALFGFWTDQYISAIGQNSSGGGGGGSSTLAGLNDVNLSNPSDGQVLMYNSSLGKWVNGNQSSYTLPLAANATRGGIQIGFTTDDSNRNYAVLLSGEKAYVNVPWTDTDTWRPVQDNLTSTSASDCLSANQGKVLKGYIDTLNGYFTDGSAKTAMKLTTARTIWGQSFDGSANITGSLTSVESITMSGWIHGTQCIEMNDDDSSNLKKYGGFIDFHFRDKFGNKMSYDDDYSARLIEGDNGKLDGVIRCCTKNPDTKYSFFAEVGLRIGNARLVWDSDSNALKVEKYDGTVANFYATGGVSALGVPTSGSGTVDTLNVNTLKAITNLYIGDNANRIYFDSDADELVIKSGSDYISMNGVINMVGSTVTTRAIYTNGGNLSLDGGRLYLAGGVYLFFESNNVKVSINGTTYTLNKS